ncbi:hypothetical protein J2Z21_005664 [Streptomyces griseochromogenes]|uniref:DUF4232 domain-containing protein n=1 Tax=Streptomyces griseochromogenes TaxID=68214 RepID=A0A1B1BA96_9ACTN|nr:DUF4232 domain-containing protein [Streptomyces griseochromogenes]ANP55689.1 hypothetical protein AVL59_44285 [Streptomyces griseochromogenes]MBP2052677.1 hypothetical protein [Streptomyces griseochromogenes]
MSVRARISAGAAVFALSALALTGCGNSDDDSSKGATDGTSASASATSGSDSGAPTSKETGSGGSATAGKSGAPATGGTNGGTNGGGVTSACTTKNTRINFVQAAQHASQQAPAQGSIEVVNTSKSTCTIVGAVTLTAKDDQGKADPVETDNSKSGTDAVDVKPGGTAKASVAYTDLNFEGSQSAREVCAVQASTVEIALPKDVGRTVKVTKDSGAQGTFNVCGKDVQVSAFKAS